MTNRIKHIGYTGPSQGLTEEGDAVLVGYLTGLKLAGTEVVGHHGDCVGGDARFHEVCLTLGFDVVIHPPVQEAKRAWCPSRTISPLVEIRPTRPYRDRNTDIVTESEELVGNLSQRGFDFYRSGEWMTINIARRLGRPRTLIDSAGRIREERGS